MKHENVGKVLDINRIRQDMSKLLAAVRRGHQFIATAD